MALFSPGSIEDIVLLAMKLITINHINLVKTKDQILTLLPCQNSH